MNNLESLLVFLAIGLAAGWMAGVLVKGRGFGVLGDIVVGILGAEIGGWIFAKVGLSSCFIGAVLMALVGALVLLAVIKMVVHVGTGKTVSAVLLMVGCSLPVHASTTVTINDDHDQKVTVIQPVPVQSVVVPVAAPSTAFEGRVVEIDGSRFQILVQDANGVDHAVPVSPEALNNYRIGDQVVIRPTTEMTLVTLAENPRDFEGEITKVEMKDGRLTVLDTTGRERRVQLKQGMIGTYKVDDYVRIHLMADLKEAKTIETVRGVRNLEGSIVSVDSRGSRIVVRGTDGQDNAVLVRQGQVQNYRSGDRVRVYLLENRDQVQVIRVIR
jgi:uncharacterized membrane protein YeaQ/YmgE (transglycosylase-associated protein family)